MDTPLIKITSNGPQNKKLDANRMLHMTYFSKLTKQTVTRQEHSFIKFTPTTMTSKTIIHISNAKSIPKGEIF